MVATAQALGALAPLRHWAPLAAQAAGARGAAPERRACALVVLSALLYGAGAWPARCMWPGTRLQRKVSLCDKKKHVIVHSKPWRGKESRPGSVGCTFCGILRETKLLRP